jgi:RNA polymerase sigma-70 factor, ECF subfamily
VNATGLNVMPMNTISFYETTQPASLPMFNDLVLANQDSAFNVAYHMLGDEASAQDITQNSFLAAYQKFYLFRGGSFRNWLLKIVKNACLDELRRRKRHPNISLDLSEDEETSPLNPHLPGKDQPFPEQMVEQNEIRRLVREALRRLPEDFRMVVVLVDLEGMDYQETARVIGIPVGTVKSRLARARLRLRDLLQEAYPQYA